MKRWLLPGLLASGLLVVAPAVTAMAQTAVSSQSASSTAQSAIMTKYGGSAQVQKASLDHYQGVLVYDVHVLDGSTVYDVKVNATTDAVMFIKLASEQPSSTSTTSSSNPSSVTSTTSVTATASSDTNAKPETKSTPPVSVSTAAVAAAGGGTVQKISSDHYQGVAVWDVHVLVNGQVKDIKLNQSTLAVMLTKVSKESLGKSKDVKTKEVAKPEGEKNHSKSAKLAQNIPAQYQAYVQNALQGGTLKWLKIKHKKHGEILLLIKVRKPTHGTFKVKDYLSAQGQLLKQKTSGH